MTGYEPLNQLKPVDDNIWIVDGPPTSFYGAPFPTRMTIVRLSDGGLFLHSPIKLTDELNADVSALGPVRHLISPNWIHYVGITDWAAAHPDAQTWASPNVRERAKKYGYEIRFDHDLHDGPEDAWTEDIDQLIVAGSSVHSEVVFFHRASQTLILTDLIENFEAKKIPLWFRPLAWMAGILDPDGKAPIDMRMTFSGGKDALRKSLKRILAWKPEKIIVSHGRWYRHDGVAELRRAFRWAL